MPSIKDILDNLKLVNNKQKKERKDTCDACPNYTKYNTCDSCGCYMPAKIQFKGSSCPLDRWPEQM